MLAGNTHLQQEYVGRGIIAGKMPNGMTMGAYFITGRSVDSCARKMVPSSSHLHAIAVNQLDPNAPLPVDHALLYYQCLVVADGNVVVSNGAQTNSIASEILEERNKFTPRMVFEHALPIAGNFSYYNDEHGRRIGVNLASFEPDAPSYTNRISLILRSGHGAFSVIGRNAHRQRTQDVTELDRTSQYALLPGRGHLVTTYAGPNVPDGQAIPRFTGKPLPFAIESNYLHEIAASLYETLGPKQAGTDRNGTPILKPGKDFRVGVLAFARTPSGLECIIINRHDGGIDNPTMFVSGV